MQTPRPYFDADAEVMAYLDAIAVCRDQWVAGACGMEVPVFRDGRWQLYVYNPALDRHGWLDFGTDLVTEVSKVDSNPCLWYNDYSGEAPPPGSSGGSDQ